MNELKSELSLTDVFTALEYQDDMGLVTTNTSGDLKDGRLFVWNEIRDKFEIDAAYFHGNVPVVYFKKFESFNNEILWDLHKSLWNHNRAPILIAVLPQEVRVYNCFASPPRTPIEFASAETPLLNRTSWQALDLLAFQENLSDYNLREIKSGRFGQTHQELLNRKHRVDARLLDNLHKVRKRLTGDSLSESIVNRLIGRSIFILYLEHRGVFKSGDHKWFAGGQSFCDVLESEEAKKETYKLFDRLSHRFNGDLFPTDYKEKEGVMNRHLQVLGRFLNGEDMDSRQMYFWAYDFNCIPIELISAIYETFLTEIQYNTSAFYTLPEIVDFVLSDIMPFDKESSRIRILDPACGSGIFLVEAYRRLVTLQSHSWKENLDFEKLSTLLQESIYGIDTNEDAIQVAIFSCYLALLDFLEPKEIWETVHFPNLKGTNMFADDFFNQEASFNNQFYDIIVGNPPWKSQLLGLANDYIQENPYPIGDNQIAQAFMWRVSTLLTDEGKACLLCPSKSTLFNLSKTHREFRDQFFAKNRVTKVVDFSTFRHKLFHNSRAPMVAVFYQKHSDTAASDDYLTYIGLHPSPLSEVLAGVVIYGDDKKRLSYQRIVNNPHIWKTALWGTPRDLYLINDLESRFLPLGKVIENHEWTMSRGVTVNGRGKKKYAPHLTQKRFVRTEAIEPFHISSSKELKLNQEWFHRARSPILFSGPHVLIRRGVRGRKGLAATFLSDDAVFYDSVIGISGRPKDTKHLKALSACINSSLSHYYHFLTSSSWGVERSEIQVAEYENFPCPNFTESENLLNEIVDLVDRIQQTGSSPQNWRPELDKLVYRMYDLTLFEQQIVDDFVKITIERHNNLKADAFKTPSLDALRLYAQAYTDVFVATTGGDIGLSPSIYKDISSYRAVSFRLTNNSKSELNQYPNIAYVAGLGNHLTTLEQIATEKHGQSMYSLKNIKVFNKNEIHIVKPAEQRFWTRSAAFNDADDTIAELLRTSTQH